MTIQYNSTSTKESEYSPLVSITITITIIRIVIETDSPMSCFYRCGATMAFWPTVSASPLIIQHHNSSTNHTNSHSNSLLWSFVILLRIRIQFTSAFVFRCGPTTARWPKFEASTNNTTSQYQYSSYEYSQQRSTLISCNPTNSSNTSVTSIVFLNRCGATTALWPTASAADSWSRLPTRPAKWSRSGRG